ncbi:hypothetical protein HDV00_007176 [Rhizophlyctis rosea]|nr:hypothetical protein HDV00_007176 [Rhizophlyctis rosea]
MSRLFAATAILAAASGAMAQSCPNIMVYGARETTAPVGMGSAGALVNQVVSAYPGAQSAAISYPACGGQSSCGGVSYDSSQQQGTANIASTVNSFASRCPNAQIVLIGYSQGGQITDQAYCGNKFSAAAVKQIKALIYMGSPTNVAGLPYNVGTCTTQGFAAHPKGYVCGQDGSKIKSYCDSADPYCCTGNDANVHQGYVNEYGSQALAFIKSKLSSTSSGGTTGGSTPATTTRTGSTTTQASTGGGSCAAKYGQCGGQGWTGATCCASGSTCKSSNAYYSQCL